MAYAPCSVCQHRFVGKAAHLYPAVAHGSDFDRAKLRLCPACAAEYMTLLGASMAVVGDHGELALDAALVCMACRAPADGLAEPVFVTVYLPGSEREDYFGVVHPPCHAAALGLLAVP